MSQSGNKYIMSMSLIHQLPHKVQKELETKSLLKVISGLNNFDLDSIAMISKAASIGGADMIDMACKPELIESIKKVTSLPICVSAVEPILFVDAVSAGATLIEIGNFDSFYKQGIIFSGEQVLNLTKQTKDLLPNIPLSVTVPHVLTLDQQVDLAIKLVKSGADIIQTEGGTSSKPSSAGIHGLFEKSVPTIAATYAIKREFEKNLIECPIMSASGLTQETSPLAITCGASAVGVGSVVNKLDDLVPMIAVIRGLKESLRKPLIYKKSLNI
tara:strand:- start:2187 stop:3002 length:816 start_codon:yes stop_codon:yes gene_type:complete